jgi:cobalt-zinc-cadmium efflux system outer membrane protein
MRIVTRSERFGRLSTCLTPHAATALATFFLGLLPFIGPAWGQEPVPRLTLDEAIQFAERENPTLRAKRFELESTRANEITGSLRPNPTAAYTAEKFGSTSFLEHTLTIGQTIELGGKRQRRIESARLATRVTTYDLADVRRQILFEVKRAFTSVLVALAALELAEQNIKTLAEVERIQRLRAERGDISQLELLRIEIQRFSFERDAADARQAVLAAKITLRSVVAPDRLPETFEV